MTTAPPADRSRSLVKSFDVALAHFGLYLLLLFILLVATTLGPIYYVVVIAFVMGAVRLRKYFAAFLSVFGVPLLSFVVAVAGYCSGSAKFETMGLPHMDFFNIDPVYRCGWETGGCLVNEMEWITQEPYNLTLRTLITTLGPQRGSYTGPYPSEDDANAALGSSSPINLAVISTDRFDVGQVHVQLDDGVGKKILASWLRGRSLADFAPGGIESDTPAHPDATIWKNRVLLLRGPSFNQMIAAIDLATGRPFAFYQGKERFPPAMWRKADDFP